jgi:hypothetical protein
MAGGSFQLVPVCCWPQNPAASRGNSFTRKQRCPAGRCLLSSCCSAARLRRGAQTRSSRRRRDRRARAMRRSVACRSVPPIPGRSAIPAASAMPRAFPRLAETQRRRSSPQHRAVHRSPAWRRPMRAHRSVSSARIKLAPASRSFVAGAVRRSASLPEFAGAVSIAEHLPGAVRRIVKSSGALVIAQAPAELRQVPLPPFQASPSHRSRTQGREDEVAPLPIVQHASLR